MIKKKNIFILIVLILNLILLFVVLKNTNKKTDNSGVEPGQTISENIDNRVSLVLNDKLLPVNHHTFEKEYDGAINVNDIYLKLNTLNNYILKIENNLDFYNNITLQYYNENYIYIKTVTTIEKYQIYKNLIAKVPKVDDINKLYQCTVNFKMETYKKEKNIIQCEMEMKYYNGETVDFILQINEKNNTFSFVF